MTLQKLLSILIKTEVGGENARAASPENAKLESAKLLHWQTGVMLNATLIRATPQSLRVRTDAGVLELPLPRGAALPPMENGRALQLTVVTPPPRLQLRLELPALQPAQLSKVLPADAPVLIQRQPPATSELQARLQRLLHALPTPSPAGIRDLPARLTAELSRLGDAPPSPPNPASASKAAEPPASPESSSGRPARMPLTESATEAAARPLRRRFVEAASPAASSANLRLVENVLPAGANLSREAAPPTRAMQVAADPGVPSSPGPTPPGSTSPDRTNRGQASAIAAAGQRSGAAQAPVPNQTRAQAGNVLPVANRLTEGTRPDPNQPPALPTPAAATSDRSAWVQPPHRPVPTGAAAPQPSARDFDGRAAVEWLPRNLAHAASQLLQQWPQAGSATGNEIETLLRAALFGTQDGGQAVDRRAGNDASQTAQTNPQNWPERARRFLAGLVESPALRELASRGTPPAHAPTAATPVTAQTGQTATSASDPNSAVVGNASARQSATEIKAPELSLERSLRDIAHPNEADTERSSLTQSNSTNALQLLDDVVQTLARLQAQPLHNLRPDGSLPQVLYAELPLRNGPQIETVEIAIRDEQTDNRHDTEAESHHVVRLRFDFPNLGVCQFLLDLRGDQLDMRFYAEAADAAQLFDAHVEHLVAELAEAHIAVNKVDSHSLQRIPSLRPLPASGVDTHV